MVHGKIVDYSEVNSWLEKITGIEGNDYKSIYSKFEDAFKLFKEKLDSVSEENEFYMKNYWFSHHYSKLFSSSKIVVFPHEKFANKEENKNLDSPLKISNAVLNKTCPRTLVFIFNILILIFIFNFISL